MHPLMHVAVYSLPGAVATCAAQYIQALQIALQATHNPDVKIGTNNIDSPLFHIPFCICHTSTTTTPPTATPLTPTRAAPALEAAALGKCCSNRTKLQVW